MKELIQSFDVRQGTTYGAVSDSGPDPEHVRTWIERAEEFASAVRDYLGSRS